MPMYEYKCEECGREFEELMSASSREQPRCPSCGAEKTRRMISACSFGGLVGDVPGLGPSGGCAPSG
jgi:putative FmdB family regulatory protein